MGQEGRTDMSQTAVDDRYFRTERVWKILLRIAPPVMLAHDQALYNIVDSYFVGQYSNSGLTALSVIFPVQLIITAIAVGTGVGVNTYMARMYAFGKKRAADCTAGTGMVLAVISWAVFAAAALLLMEPYVRTSATSSGAVADAVLYGNIVCVGSLGIFLESIWTKVHQAGGNMRLPMLAQIAGALTNIVLDPILIFGLGPVPRMGIAGSPSPRWWASVWRRSYRDFRLPAAAQAGGDAEVCSADLPPGLSLYFHADAVHRVYHGSEYDPGRVFGRRGDRVGSVLSAPVLFLHPAQRTSDLYRAHPQL